MPCWYQERHHKVSDTSSESHTLNTAVASSGDGNNTDQLVTAQLEMTWMYLICGKMLIPLVKGCLIPCPQIHAGGAHLEERESNRQPRSCGLFIQLTSLDGSKGPAGGGGPGEYSGGCQVSAQTV